MKLDALTHNTLAALNNQKDGLKRFEAKTECTISTLFFGEDFISVHDAEDDKIVNFRITDRQSLQKVVWNQDLTWMVASKKLLPADKEDFAILAEIYAWMARLDS